MVGAEEFSIDTAAFEMVLTERSPLVVKTLAGPTGACMDNAVALVIFCTDDRMTFTADITTCVARRGMFVAVGLVAIRAFVSMVGTDRVTAFLAGTLVFITNEFAADVAVSEVRLTEGIVTHLASLVVFGAADFVTGSTRSCVIRAKLDSTVRTFVGVRRAERFATGVTVPNVLETDGLVAD